MVAELGFHEVLQPQVVHMAVKQVVVVLQQHEEPVLQRGVVLREDVGQVEVGVDDAGLLGFVPVDVDGGFYADEPLQVDVREVVLVDAYLSAAYAAAQEVVADEVDELLGVTLVVVGHQSRVQRVAQQLVQLPELLGLVIRRPAGPVEVVLRQHAEDGAVGQEGYLLGVEGSEEHGRQVRVLRSLAAQRHDELYERFLYRMAGALLGLGP